MEGLFIHSASNREVMAGQGTIGVEIVENMPDVDAVITPFGGGGLTAGVASAVRALKPATRLCACELETGAPSVGADTWPILSSVVGGSLIMSVADLVSTLKLLVERNRGGRGAVASALSGGAGEGEIACVVSGGHIDSDVLAAILDGTFTF